MYLIDNRIGQIGTVFVTLYDHTKYQILILTKPPTLTLIATITAIEINGP